MARTPVRSLLVIALLLSAAAPTNAGGNVRAADVAEGAISLLISKRCEKSARGEEHSLDWAALVYARGKPPSWGRKEGSMCRGLDTWVISEAVAAGVYWSTNDHAVVAADPMKTMFDDVQINAAFKKAYGWELPERGDDVPPRNVFLKFESKKLSKLFDSLYLKPTDKVADVTAQDVYNIFLKDFVTRIARETAAINTALPKAKLAKLAKDYQAAAKNDSRFHGPTFLNKAAAETLPQDQPDTQRAAKTLGIILRRTADGTWPVVGKLLKKVIADYDPELSKEIGKKL
jgi:hypothetical protein